MNDYLMYLLKSTLCISLLYWVFRTLMRKETFFALNRILLVSMVLFSLAIPLVQMPLIIQPSIPVQLIPAFASNENAAVEQPIAETSENVAPSYIAPQVISNSSQPGFQVQQFLVFGYILGLLIALLILIRSVLSIFLIIRKAEIKQLDGFRLVIIKKEIPAFSFGRFVIISQQDYEDHRIAMLAHERAHIQLNHFFDLILLETVKIFHWFNPVMYLVVRDMKEIHEFQADDYTLSNGIDATQYQLLIIQKSVGSQRFALANSFNHCQIEKRIAMINKQKTSKVGSWKAAAFLPLLALLLMAFGRTIENAPPESTGSTSFEIGTQIEYSKLNQEQRDQIDMLVPIIARFRKSPILLSEVKKSPTLPPDLKNPKLYVVDGAITEQKRANYFLEVGVDKVIYLNGKDATDKYGEKGKNGVVEMILKKNASNSNDSGSKQKTGSSEKPIAKSDQVSQINNTLESKGGTVKGKVILPDGKPLREIAVIIMGTHLGTRTDINGFFELADISKETYLVLRHLGMKAVTVYPDFEKEMIIKMVPDAYRLDRVKVVGILNDINPPLPPSRVSMFNTGNSSSIPMFILNGVIVEKSIFDQIEPDDLASVIVLKEKMATDKYGEKAKYGALEITTKKKVSITIQNTTDNVEVPEYADNQKILELQPVYNVVEEMPEYPGGMNVLMKFIADNLKFSAQAKTDKVQGTVEVNFVINSYGKVENVKVTKEVHPELDAEAIRLIGSMPDWKPGKLNGKGVDVSYTMPIQFAFK